MRPGVEGGRGGWGPEAGGPGEAAEGVPAPSTRSANGMLMNMMMMSDENHRDIYISTVAVPPPGRCAACREASRAHPGEGLGRGAGCVLSALDRE